MMLFLWQKCTFTTKYNKKQIIQFWRLKKMELLSFILKTDLSN